MNQPAKSPGLSISKLTDSIWLGNVGALVVGGWRVIISNTCFGVAVLVVVVEVVEEGVVSASLDLRTGLKSSKSSSSSS